MSKIIKGEFGRYNLVWAGDELGTTPLWECPKCLHWHYLAEEQGTGQVSVICGLGDCDYHETHNFAADLHARATSNALFGKSPFEENEDACGSASPPVGPQPKGD